MDKNKEMIVVGLKFAGTLCVSSFVKSAVSEIAVSEPKNKLNAVMIGAGKMILVGFITRTVVNEFKANVDKKVDIINHNTKVFNDIANDMKEAMGGEYND